MEKAGRTIVRHFLAAIFLVLAVLGGLIPILQGWMFFVLAVLILALEYRWIRNLALRPIYRRYPQAYRKTSRWRRKMRIQCAKRFRPHKKQTILLKPPRRSSVAPTDSHPPKE